MRGIIPIAFLIIFTLSIVTDEKWTKMVPSVSEFARHNIKLLRMAKNFLNSSMYEHIEFQDFIGSGNNSVVLSGVQNGQEIALKLYFEFDENYSICKTAYSVYQAIVNTGRVKYLISMDELRFFKNDDNYICAIMMGNGYPADKYIVPDKLNIPENTNKIVNFVVKTLEAYGQLHFEANYYHGDCQPSNLFYVKVMDTIEPRIVNFDFAFFKNSQRPNPEYMLYIPYYRPPELLKFAPALQIENTQRYAYSKYKFDLDFREEAYAIGMTLREIMINNWGFFSTSDPRILAIFDILSKITKKNIGDRISVIRAWIDLLSQIKSIEKQLI